MPQINFLPETIIEKRTQKQRGRRGFMLSFSLLAITLSFSLAVLVYQNTLLVRKQRLDAQIREESTKIQSLKNTEGLYRSLKLKAEQLNEVLQKRQDYPQVILEIKNNASLANVSLQKYTLGKEQQLKLTAVTSSYGDLVNFLQLLPRKKGSVLEYVSQNEEKGYIEFELRLPIG